MYTRVLRFAPSPNGYLHLGHAYSALLNYDMARELGGRLLLRIEDIDAARCRPEYEAAIYEDLRWLGISWAEPVRRQSEHFADYQAAIRNSKPSGSFIRVLRAAARSTRSSPSASGKGPGRAIPTACRSIPGGRGRCRLIERERRRRAGEPFALRLAMDAAVARAGVLTWSETGSGPQGQTGLVTAAPQRWGDVVLARKELPTSYHLAVVVDDALQGVTDVVRGQDLFWSTSIHRLLQALLGLAEPVYHHHRLILDDDGRKLSKATQATSLRQLRAAGATAVDVRRMVGLGR